MHQVLITMAYKPLTHTGEEKSIRASSSIFGTT